MSFPLFNIIDGLFFNCYDIFCCTYIIDKKNVTKIFDSSIFASTLIIIIFIWKGAPFSDLQILFVKLFYLLKKIFEKMNTWKLEFFIVNNYSIISQIL